jgi:PAS domain S-box-containing protein
MRNGRSPSSTRNASPWGFLPDPYSVERASGVNGRLGEALRDAADGLSGVVLLGLEALDDESWAVLAAAGIRLEWAAETEDALRALTCQSAQLVIADLGKGADLAAAVRARRELASAHIILCVSRDSPHALRKALAAGADDVIRLPFEPEVLALKVTAALRAARLRANEALLRSLVTNVPGAVYRCACDDDWTMEWLSDGIEDITGYPASDFIRSAVRTFTSVIHPDDREQVQQSVLAGVDANRPFTLEYRIQRRDGAERWVLERGQLQEAHDGRRWLDGAIFDITARRAAEQALREREIVEAQLAEVRASRARILEAADRARREIERNLHDGAQQRFVSVALRLQASLATTPDLRPDKRAELGVVLEELRAGLADLRALAHGLHPAVLSDRGLEHALLSLVNRAGVPVDLRTELPQTRLPMPVEAAAYFTVCEALTNVAKYAHARRAWVTVTRSDGHLVVEVGDDGVGGASVGSGSGLQGLRDRLAAINGTLDIESRSGGGTIVRGWLPIDDGHPARRAAGNRHERAAR